MSYSERPARQELPPLNSPCHSAFFFANFENSKKPLFFLNAVLIQQNYPRWLHWNLTEPTQFWWAKPLSNYGVILWATNEDQARVATVLRVKHYVANVACFSA